MENERKKFTCRRCSYVWLTRRSAHPVVCARCKRRDWDKKDVKTTGQQVAVPFYNR